MHSDLMVPYDKRHGKYCAQCCGVFAGKKQCQRLVRVTYHRPWFCQLERQDAIANICASSLVSQIPAISASDTWSHGGVVCCGCSAIYHGLPRDGVSFKHHQPLFWSIKYIVTQFDRFSSSRTGEMEYITPRQTTDIVRSTTRSWRVWSLVIGPTVLPVCMLFCRLMDF
jgi:hypothetical protein